MTKSILCPGARMGIFQHPVKNAYDSAPADISGCLELTQATRSHIACGVVRQQFLQVMGL